MSLMGFCVIFVYLWAVFCTCVAVALYRDGYPAWLSALVVIVPGIGLALGLSAGG